MIDSLLMGRASSLATWLWALVSFAAMGGGGLVAAARGDVREGRLPLLPLRCPFGIAAVPAFFATYQSRDLWSTLFVPAYPFLLLFTAQFLVGSYPPVRTTAASIIVALTIVAAIRIYPHHLSYFKEAVGGPERGPYLLDDSNLDWGQDLPALAAWQRAHFEATPIKLSYHGLADPAS